KITSTRERVMNAVTASQLTSMLQGAITRGSGSGVRLPVPVAGKTGTTNDAKDVWFVGYTSTLAAGCYMGYDQPRSLGPGAFGGTLCVPIFQEFMAEAIKRFGGADFTVPEGGYFQRVDRFTGARLGPDSTGDNVISEFFREGEVGLFGIDYVVDGGFGMGANLPLFAAGETDFGAHSSDVLTTSDGST
ncbi:MAG: penicillin-binding transpeptidase domain-containing protein, partial [Cypionkella sp.]